MAEEPHHSIGEVLSLLKEDHADVTISKIRFLESQGLISPERTPSGYRKFYRDDIDRLRWILSQQRDSFLPLKVIKRRLAEEGFDPAAELDTDDTAGPLPEPSLFSNREDEAADEPAEDASAESAAPVEAAEAAPESEPAPAPAAASSATVGSVSMTAGELADATGSDLGFVTELDRMGLIESVETGDGPVYDHEALLATRAAVRFRESGMEPRHLRMHKVAADREAGLLQQLRGAALSRGGEAAATARQELADLIDQGEALRRSILRRELGLDR